MLKQMRMIPLTGHSLVDFKNASSKPFYVNIVSLVALQLKRWYYIRANKGIEKQFTITKDSFLRKKSVFLVYL